MTERPFDLDRIGAGLPVAEAAARLTAALQDGAVVVTAPPGTGKTTLVPPLVANETEAGARVLLTQPRRVAVRAAARRLATLDGSDLGERVGFTVRGERRVGARTRVEVVTPGVLLRRLLRDPGLDGMAAVVLDEVHERSLDGDLCLAMLVEARALRPDLRLVVMSATLDAEGLQGVLAHSAERVPVVQVPGVLHPLEVAYDPGAAQRLDARGVTREFLEHTAQVTAREHAAIGSDALVFLPGVREVEEVVGRLRALVPASEVLALHGRQPAREQDRATGGRGPQDPPRVVVTTAIAESSVTVPGVHLVIDAGLSREVRRDRGRDMSGLVTVSASRASAEQRAGRAARLGPGRVVRLFDEPHLARMPASSPPQILTSDLLDACLLLAAWGTPRGEGLPLPDAPPAVEVARAEELLRALDLVDEEGRITAAGREVAGMPVGVREARALVEGARRAGDARGSRGDGARAAAQVVAALSDDHRAEGADAEALVRFLRSGRAPGAQRWRREVHRLASLVGATSGGADPSDVPLDASQVSVGTVIALGRPERIARRAQEDGSVHLLASGTRAALPPGSPLIAHPWLAVWEVQRAEGRAAQGTGAIIRSAAPLSEEDALELGAGLLRQERIARLQGDAVRVRLERRLGAIGLSSTPQRAAPEDRALAVREHIRSVGVDRLPWSAAATALRARLALLHRALGAPWPAVDGPALTARIEEWAGTQVPPDLLGGLRALLPWPQAADLDELVPERLRVPSGNTHRIDYAPVLDGQEPVMAVKLQEMFGLAETPRLVQGRVGLVVHLLSPAGRPLAVTADLASFWDGPYQEVRKEMRGRYPKHPWPQDPWTAPATARTQPRPRGS